MTDFEICVLLFLAPQYMVSLMRIIETFRKYNP